MNPEKQLIETALAYGAAIIAAAHKPMSAESAKATQLLRAKLGTAAVVYATLRRGEACLAPKGQPCK